MRLIDTKTLQLVEVAPDQKTRYAILSHRWLVEEVTYAEFMHPTAETKSKPGYRKIEKLCEKAVRDDLHYAWADTCCIDKSSSAELSEAINSMYSWYQDAAACYVFMDDVSPDDSPFHPDSEFIHSAWHTRGWTLQELLAPQVVKFYCSEWTRIGTKVTLAHPLERAAGIDTDILLGFRAVRDASVAQRMSWASTRVTTRPEDMAYCLMGIFDVNMAVLYGERDKAFRRLQEEIMKGSNDQSLFAWSYSSTDAPEGGLLAPHPRNFLDSGQFENKSEFEEFERLSYEAVKGGISVSVFLEPYDEARQYAVLKCNENNQGDCYARIYLRSTGRHSDEYIRVSSPNRHVERSRMLGNEQTVLVLHQSPPKAAEAIDTEKYFRLLVEPPYLPSQYPHPCTIEVLTVEDDPVPISAHSRFPETSPRYTYLRDRLYRVTDPNEFAYRLQHSRGSVGRKGLPRVSDLEQRFGLQSTDKQILRQRSDDEIMKLRFGVGDVYSDLFMSVIINSKRIPKLLVFPGSLTEEEYKSQLRSGVAQHRTQSVIHAEEWTIPFPRPVPACIISLRPYYRGYNLDVQGLPTVFMTLAWELTRAPLPSSDSVSATRTDGRDASVSNVPMR